MNDDRDESFVIETVLRHRPPALATRTTPGELRHFAPGDDAARVGANEVVTVDTMVEGIHFDHRLSPGDVGWKLVAVNASDVGAMGCTPTWALLSLSLPKPLDHSWVSEFAQGMGEALERWRIHLIGGDTTGSPGVITASMTMAGTGARLVGRSGAQAGDILWVTGLLGEAAAGFILGTEPGLTALRRPQPPVRFGAALTAAVPIHAMMDISDGLGRDLGRMCRDSGVSARVDSSTLPIGPGLQESDCPLPAQVAFGEDYQLMFAAPPDAEDTILSVAQHHSIQVTPAGHFLESQGDHRAQLDDQEWPRASFTHFEVAG